MGDLVPLFGVHCFCRIGAPTMTSSIENSFCALHPSLKSILFPPVTPFSLMSLTHSSFSKTQNILRNLTTRSSLNSYDTSSFTLNLKPRHSFFSGLTQFLFSPPHIVLDHARVSLRGMIPRLHQICPCSSIRHVRAVVYNSDEDTYRLFTDSIQ